MTRDAVSLEVDACVGARASGLGLSFIVATPVVRVRKLSPSLASLFQPTLALRHEHDLEDDAGNTDD
jgi:hypothetical protein